MKRDTLDYMIIVYCGQSHYGSCEGYCDKSVIACIKFLAWQLKIWNYTITYPYTTVVILSRLHWCENTQKNVRLVYKMGINH